MASGDQPEPATEPATTAAAQAGGPVTVASPERPRLADTTRERFQDRREIARGGMGRVIAAHDQALDRPVALKELLAARPELAARFLREVRLTARLQHPAIVPLYEAGRFPDGEPFYVMRLVAGRSFDQALADAADFDQRLALLPHVIAVADAIAYAHSQRIVHRDLKPANILIGEFGDTMVIDWGIAKDLAEDEVAGEAAAAPTALATLSGSVLGTPVFMAPEQAAGQPVDERADVYALGALLYRMLAGSGPYQGKTGDDVIAHVRSGPPPPLRARAPGVPRDLEAIVTRAMARDPAARPSARELAAELRRFQTGRLVASHEYSAWELVTRWLARHLALVSVGLLALVVVAAVSWFSVRRVLDERDRAERARRAADESVAHLLEEQGREELLAGHGPSAAVFLSAAYGRQSAPDPALRFLLGASLRGLDAELVSLDGQRGGVQTVAWLTGTRLAAVSEGGLRLWDTSGTTVATLKTAGAPAPVVAGGRLALVTPGGTVVVADADGNLRATLPTGLRDLRALALSPDAQTLALGDGSGVIELWQVAGAVRRSSFPAGGAIAALGFSPDGARLVSAADHTAVVWDAGGARLATLTGHEDAVTLVSFSPDGKLLLTGAEDGSARTWEAAGGAARLTLAAGGPVVSAVFSPDGRRIATASTRSARVWDAASGAEVTTIDKLSGYLRGIVFSPDGASVLTASTDHTARLWDTGSGAALAAFAHADNVNAAAFSPDGTRIATASRDRSAKLWDVQRGSLRLAPTAAGAAPAAQAAQLPPALQAALAGAPVLAVSRDGAHVLTASDRTAKLWDTATGKLTKLEGHLGNVTAAAFDHSGRRVITASKDRSARIWDTGGALLSALEGHQSPVTGAAFSDDDALVATASQSRAVRVWDAASGRQLASVPSGGPVRTVWFTPDSRRLGILHDDGHIDAWDIPRETRPAAEVARLVSRLPLHLVEERLVPTTPAQDP